MQGSTDCAPTIAGGRKLANFEAERRRRAVDEALANQTKGELGKKLGAGSQVKGAPASQPARDWPVGSKFVIGARR